MLFGSACLLIAAAGFATELPASFRATLLPEKETSGTFVQTKSADGREYVSKGTFLVRPGTGFEWRTLEPFESLFAATKEKYVYSNEDERVERRLSDLPGFSAFAGAQNGDFSAFFSHFDALCAEKDGRFYVRARPKEQRIKRALSKIDVEGTADDWTLRAELVGGTVFSIRLVRRKPETR